MRVSYKSHLDGGGSTFGQDFILLLRRRGMPKSQRAFEWCAGPGFIGFSLLAHGLTDTLCLADVNPEAVAACRRTVARNGLEAKVAVYHSDNLGTFRRPTMGPGGEQPAAFRRHGFGHLRYHDPDWRVHRGFFAGVARHLKPGGVIVLQENNEGSTPATFAPMIAAGRDCGLVFVQDASRNAHRAFAMFYLGSCGRATGAGLGAGASPYL